jgi:hypothetical protein
MAKKKTLCKQKNFLGKEVRVRDFGGVAMEGFGS